MEHLKEMMAADNYKENLGTLIRSGLKWTPVQTKLHYNDADIQDNL